MLLSSLTDPVDLARAQAAFDAAWNEIKPSVPTETAEKERLRLSYIVSAMASRCQDEGELTKRSVERYRRAVRTEDRNYEHPKAHMSEQAGVDGADRRGPWPSSQP